MATEAEGIRNFVLEFLKNLQCNFEWKEEILVVNSVPKDFEDFVGKRVPYKLVFEKGKGDEDAEIMIKGGYMLKAMMNYLGDRGQTTLLKLEFNFDSKEELNKHLKFKNCEIGGAIKDIENQTFLRFTFLTTLQYFNEKEQIMNEIYVNNEGVIDFKINNYVIVEGKKEDVKIKDVKLYYAMAKEKLKERVAKNIAKAGENLNKKLEKEIERIKEHYGHQLGELDEQTNKNNAQIKELETHLEKSDEKDRRAVEHKIDKLKESNQHISKDDEKEKLRKEEEFFINDEVRKHSLNIDNKLMNTSIIYYPVYTFKISLQNGGVRRQLDLEYNPITEKLQIVNCETCGKEINSILLCSSGHLVCKDCTSKCGSCGKDYCISCLGKNCEICGKEICRKCSVKCSKCGKFVCVEHSKRNSSSGTVCLSCLRKCPSCGEFYPKDSFKKCPNCSKEVCERCSRKEFLNSDGKIFCKSCSKTCGFCGKIYSLDNFKRCSECKTESCNYPGKCKNCRRQLCPKLKLRR